MRDLQPAHKENSTYNQRVGEDPARVPCLAAFLPCSRSHLFKRERSLDSYLPGEEVSPAVETIRCCRDGEKPMLKEGYFPWPAGVEGRRARRYQFYITQRQVCEAAREREGEVEPSFMAAAGQSPDDCPRPDSDGRRPGERKAVDDSESSWWAFIDNDSTLRGFGLGGQREVILGGKENVHSHTERHDEHMEVETLGIEDIQFVGEETTKRKEQRGGEQQKQQKICPKRIPNGKNRSDRRAIFNASRRVKIGDLDGVGHEQRAQIVAKYRGAVNSNRRSPKIFNRSESPAIRRSRVHLRREQLNCKYFGTSGRVVIIDFHVDQGWSLGVDDLCHLCVPRKVTDGVGPGENTANASQRELEQSGWNMNKSRTRSRALIETVAIQLAATTERRIE
ncbi:hypothetical protein C8R47DRAFT_1198501 [Mycena vitilis]|nr:hypothetical protein C8R47DRAFT_1198501 [Mycena vitilis]